MVVNVNKKRKVKRDRETCTAYRATKVVGSRGLSSVTNHDVSETTTSYADWKTVNTEIALSKCLVFQEGSQKSDRHGKKAKKMRNRLLHWNLYN